MPGSDFVIVLLGLYCDSHSGRHACRAIRRQSDTRSWNRSDKCADSSHTAFDNFGRLESTDCQPSRHGTLPRLPLFSGFRASRNLDSVARTNDAGSFRLKWNSSKIRFLLKILSTFITNPLVWIDSVDIPFGGVASVPRRVGVAVLHLQHHRRCLVCRICEFI